MKNPNVLIWTAGGVWWACQVSGVEHFRHLGIFTLEATREFARLKGYALEIRMRGGRG